MITEKPGRKDFGLARSAANPWDLRLLHESARINGDARVEKDAQSVLEASGFVLTPKLAGSDEIRQPYLESWVVHACLRVIADAIEQVGFKVWDGPEATAKPLGEDHPMVRLFARPNPWTSWSQHCAMGSIHRGLSGEDFWFLCDADGKPIVKGPDAERNPMCEIDVPVSINSVNGAAVADDRGTNGRVMRWKYGTSAGAQQIFPAGSVLHFRDYDPTDPVRGVGPVEVAMRQLSIAFQAERYAEATLRSGGPGAFVLYEHEISPEMQRQLQEDMDQATKDPRSVGKLKVLTGKPQVVPIPQSPKDMMSIEQLKWSRDVVASLNGVPLPIIGVLDNATYSNMKEAWRQFWLFRIAYMKTVEDVVNTSFFPRLRDPSLRRLRFAFDLSSVAALKADDAELLKLVREIMAGGFGLTFNEVMDLVGAQASHPPNGDVPLYLAQLQTAPNGARAEVSSAVVAAKVLNTLLEELKHGTVDPTP